MRIVIPGGSGQVGRILARHIHAQGHTVTVLSRSPRAAPWRTLFWDGVTAGSWVAELEQAEVCINLAGRSVNCCGKANRRAIVESHVRSTLLLNQVIASLKQPPRLWVNSSTATIYRHALDLAMDEASGELGGREPGAPDTWNLSIDVAKRWEEAFLSVPTPRTRKIASRSAITFSPDRGGVFDVLLVGLVRRGLGGTQGPGTQYISWIHESDFVRAMDVLIAGEKFSGIVNLASPSPLPNRDFMRALRDARGIRTGLPVASWMLEIGAVALRTESELVRKSRRVVPDRLRAAGFQFRFPEWPAAARELVARWREKLHRDA